MVVQSEDFVKFWLTVFIYQERLFYLDGRLDG